MKKLLTMLVAAALAVGLPLIGVHYAGRPVETYLEFPPLTRYVEHAGFSWVAFVLLAAFILAVILPFSIRSLTYLRTHSVAAMPAARRFPWWGWIGLVLNAIFWVIAWNRFDLFYPVQEVTFGPLWISYIIVVNAWTFKRSGRCMMINRPHLFIGLFALSAIFWWYFEYLNRFVQNWYYEGVGCLGSFDYFIFGTIPFSTVLPAVLGTYELLKSNPRLGAGLDDFAVIRVTNRRLLAVVALVIASFGLAGLDVWPDYLFPLLWISPLVIVTGLKTLSGYDTVFTPIRQGRWRNLCLLALASLICGWFWEMWNYHSLAKWLYAVPFVGEFKIFEMPVLGFAGYLPFGIECAVVAELAGFEEKDET